MAQLDFGIHYSCQSPERDWDELYRATLEQASLAEELGYQSLFVAEHHFLPDGWIPAPTVFLGGLAAVTDSMRIGTDVIVLPLHHPIEIAEHAAVLDNLSGGNFHLGVSIGWRDEEFEAFGVDKRERVKRTVEGIELIRALLTEEEVSYSGDLVAVEELTVMPRPVQSSIPIWYGGQSPPAIRRAARMADGWVISPIETYDELREEVDIYREALDEYGRSYDEVWKPLRREAYVAADDQTAWEEVGEALLYEYRDVYGDYDDAGHSFDVDDSDKAIEALQRHAEDRFIVGSPETAIRELERYHDAFDIDEVLLRMHFPGLETERATNSMRLVAEEVMPHFE